MSDEIFLGGKTYVSSKRAAAATGYAQDYIGQLARSGTIDAQRVGGLWYVFPESLDAYKRNTEAFKPVQPVSTKSPMQDLETIISFDGKDYVSSSKAAKLTGYNPDYVGQLARSGKILSRQIGNRWYVEREALLSHKRQKDSLLATVQAESAGLVKPPPEALMSERKVVDHGPYLTYIRENDNLFPTLIKAEAELPRVPAHTAVPIRIVRNATPIAAVPHPLHAPMRQQRSTPSGKTISRAVKVVAALTVVVVLSYGLSTVRSGAIYAAFQGGDAGVVSSSAMPASVAVAFERISLLIESFVTKELRYQRAR